MQYITDISNLYSFDYIKMGTWRKHGGQIHKGELGSNP